MTFRSLVQLALALVLTVQGMVPAAAAPMDAAPAAVEANEVMPCHGDDSAPAPMDDCCGESCMSCDLHCGGAALTGSMPAPAPFAPVGNFATLRVPPVHAAYRDSRLRPPDSALA